MRVTTANLDFATGPRRDGPYLKDLCEHADVLALQEAKNLTLSELLPRQWRSMQGTFSEARRGSALAYNSMTTLGFRRRMVIGVRPWWRHRKIEMLTRWIQWADFRDADGGQIIRVFDLHLPPGRFAQLQPHMIRRLRRLINQSPHPVVVCADWNMPYERVAAILGLESHGMGIIGILWSRELRVTPVRHDLSGVRSDATDHCAVSIEIHTEKASKVHRLTG